MIDDKDLKKQDSLYSKDLFIDEMQMINDELANIDELYNELKDHFDRVKNSQVRGSLTFIKDQTGNLISLKTAKLNYIRQKADLKKNITDFAFREKTISNKEASDGTDIITAEIYKRIASDFKYIPDKNQVLKNHNDYADENDIDKMLDDELSDLDIGDIVESSTSIDEVVVEYNSDTEEYEVITNNDSDNIELEEIDTNDDNKTIIVVDLDTYLFYELDKNTFDIIEELGHIEKIVDTTDIEDETYAIGESGTIYLTVIFEEDDD